MQRLLLVLTALLLAPAVAGAQATTFTYQGVLAVDGAVEAGPQTHTMTFRLFDAQTGGTEVWSETHTGVAVLDGVFTVELGTVETLASIIPFTQQLYLEVEVLGSAFQDRIKLTAAPYVLGGGGGGGGNPLLDGAFHVDPSLPTRVAVNWNEAPRAQFHVVANEDARALLVEHVGGLAATTRMVEVRRQGSFGGPGPGSVHDFISLRGENVGDNAFNFVRGLTRAEGVPGVEVQFAITETGAYFGQDGIGQFFLSPTPLTERRVALVDNNGQAVLSNAVASNRVLGVVHSISTTGSGANTCRVFIMGRAMCRVTGPVSPGDILVSNSDGSAIRASGSPAVGTVLGKALESVANGNSQDALILVTLQ